MSKFSVYLKELLKQRDEPIARIAKNAGLERTSIHKALKDERLLSYTALKQLTQYLQLTLPQIRELNQYYEMLLQGEDIFRIQEAICDLLFDLSQLHFSAYEQAVQMVPDFKPSSLTDLIYGRPQVESAIQSILQQETEEKGTALSLYLPSKCTLTDGLLRFWKLGREFTAHQLVAFLPNHSGMGTQLENIHLLQRLLPLSLMSRNSYFAYYYFEDNAAPVSIDPMPYFIVTPHYLITMDCKLSVAQFQTAPALIQLYQRRFDQVVTECQPLNSYTNDLENILESYMDASGQEGYYTIMTQPCLGHYYTRELIERHFRADVPDREMLIELSDRRFELLRGLHDNYYTIFSEAGLCQLAEDGAAVDLPPEFILPLDVSDRLDMFRALRQDIKQGIIRGCIADMERLPIPPYLTLTCDPKFGVHIYTVQGFVGGTYACNLHIQESSIGQSFCAFIKSLPDSKFVYSKEKNVGYFRSTDPLVGRSQWKKALKTQGRWYSKKSDFHGIEHKRNIIKFLCGNTKSGGSMILPPLFVWIVLFYLQ